MKQGSSLINKSILDKINYHGLLMFLKDRGRGLVLFGVLFLGLFIIPNISNANELESNNEIYSVEELFTKLNFLSNPLAKPLNFINTSFVDMDTFMGWFRGSKIAQDETQGIQLPDNYKIPKDLTGDDFINTLMIIGLFIWNILVVFFNIIKETVIRGIEYIK